MQAESFQLRLEQPHTWLTVEGLRGVNNVTRGSLVSEVKFSWS
jgi:hypothetical protein